MPPLIDPLLRDILTVQDVAAMCELTEAAVKKAIYDGRLPARDLGRWWAIHRTAAERFRDSDRTPGRKALTATARKS
jgi:hypothetical protein